ncbi:IS110 family transposase [Actinopolymorpha pittospori]|uniref:Transposase n=2 Tax=Actinopolymorpha pittospori TaxID=648752 RepID=A0A927N0Q7_9ACTN|nr:transposase [Actinopolymorpha pittospori]
MDGSGRRLAKARLPEGVAGMARLHAMIGERVGEDAEESLEQVVIGIETDRGPWVQALIAAGYRVYAVNPLQASRYRERHGVSGAKSDGADAHMLADMVRTDSHQLRPVAGDSAQAAAIKVVARAHKNMIWERTRHMQRLRHALRDYFPAALEAFEELTALDALELLAKAPDPASAAKLSLTQIRAALKRAGRRGDIDAKANKIQAALRVEHLAQPAVVAQAYAATVRAAVAVLGTLNEQIKTLQGQVEEHFGEPGLGPILGARVLAEFGDDQHRYASAKARKNYAGTSPITRASGKKEVVAARYVHNDRLVDALVSQVVPAMVVSPGVRALYDELRARDIDHFTACRHLANRLVGILHGCLKTRTLYNEKTAWSHRSPKPETSAAAA